MTYWSDQLKALRASYCSLIPPQKIIHKASGKHILFQSRTIALASGEKISTYYIFDDSYLTALSAVSCY